MGGLSKNIYKNLLKKSYNNTKTYPNVALIDQSFIIFYLKLRVGGLSKKCIKTFKKNTTIIQKVILMLR